MNDLKKIWLKINEFIRKSKQNEQLKSTITTSAVFFESGQNSYNVNVNNQTQSNQYSHLSDHFHDAIYGNNQLNDRQVPKSYSLSRITGKNYQRNLLTIDNTKSISNEFLNRTNSFSIDDTHFEYNNNNNLENSLITQQNNDLTTQTSTTSTTTATTKLQSKNFVPNYGINKLDRDDLHYIIDYLINAFKNQYHPLGILNAKISFGFYTSYGCWKVKPIAILSTQAMREWENISKRIYDIVRKLFPMLPIEYGNFDE